MTTANMKVVMLSVVFPDQIELSDAKLDEGEYIVKRVVEITRLKDELDGMFIVGFLQTWTDLTFQSIPGRYVEMSWRVTRGHLSIVV